MRFPDYYGLLGIDPDHDPDELREAFQERWKETDGFWRGERIFLRHLGVSARRRDLLCEAYAVLADPGLRQAYHLRAGIPSIWRTVPPDRRAGMTCFREGCRRLIHRDHDAAYRFFRKALDKSPGEVNYINYAVFSLLVSNQRREVARNHLNSSLSLDPRRAESMLLLAWMQRRSGANRLAENAIRRSGEYPVSDAPLFLRLKQIPDLLTDADSGIWHRIVGETRSAFGISIRISTR
jgi:tetratricopeptide (TPR) repeat protein